LLHSPLAYAGVSTVYGARAYNSNASTWVNCAGYAVGYNAWYGFDIRTSSNVTTWNACSSTSELIAAVKQQMVAYINARPTLSSVWTKKNSYSYSVVTSSQYKTVFKIAYHDSDGVSGISISTDQLQGDKFDFHWRFLDSAGRWCEKAGANASHICNGTTAVPNENGVNPYSLSWYIGTSTYTYNYQGYHYLRSNW